MPAGWVSRLPGERGQRGADITPLRRGVQALQSDSDRPVADHVAEEAGRFGMSEPGAGQEQGSREGRASHPGVALLPRQEPGGPRGPEDGGDRMPAGTGEGPGRFEMDGGHEGARAVAQLVARAQVRTERGELDAAEDVAGAAATVVKAGSVGRGAAWTCRRSEPAQPVRGGSGVLAGHDLDGMG